MHLVAKSPNFLNKFVSGRAAEGGYFNIPAGREKVTLRVKQLAHWIVSNGVEGLLPHC